MSGRRAVREERRGKNSSENFESFDPGDQHPEALAKVFEILAFEAQNNTRHRRMPDFSEWLHVHGFRALDTEFCQLVSGAGVDDSFVLGAAFFSARGELDPPTRFGSAQTGH